MTLGGPKAVQDEEHYSIIARSNLIAAKRAREMSEFTSAFNYLNNGITFLRKYHWKTEYELSLELYNLAAKCALIIKDLTSLTILCSVVSKNAHNLDDVLYTSVITMSGLTHTNAKLSIQHGLTILHQLGIGISELPREETLQQVAHIGTLLDAVSDEILLDCHILIDYKVNMAMKVLAKMCTSVYQCNPSLFPLVVITLVRLTIEHSVVSDV